MDLATAIQYAQKIAAGNLTAQDETTFFEWLHQAPVEEYRVVADAYYMALEEAGAYKEEHGELLQRIDASIRRQPVVKELFPLYRWRWVAASIVLVLGTVGLIWMSNKNNPATNAIEHSIVDNAPGSAGAILTLADGRQVVLDSLNNGVIASQNGSNVVLKDGLLAYDLTGISTEDVVYNTISTPNGRQFEVALPDGTKVWLNAGSSIRYPTVFTKQQRKVEVTGEVYMEVAANKSKPFLVTAGDMEVQVLGTSFNINAYSDEPAIKTTLLNGSIKVLKKTQPRSGIILTPGQQAILDENITLNSTVDIDQIISWKNGVFNFNGATLEEFMRQLARWYDLTIVYQGAIPNKTFNGKIGRDLQLSQILKVLTQFNITYQLSGKTITIEPQ